MEGGREREKERESVRESERESERESDHEVREIVFSTLSLQTSLSISLSLSTLLCLSLCHLSLSSIYLVLSLMSLALCKYHSSSAQLVREQRTEARQAQELQACRAWAHIHHTAAMSWRAHWSSPKTYACFRPLPSVAALVALNTRPVPSKCAPTSSCPFRS